MLKKILLSNVVVAGLMLASPVMAANPTAISPSQPTSARILLAEVDIDALNAAADALQKGAVAMNAAESAKSADQVQKHFSTALSAMGEAAGLLEKAGIPEAAKAMNRAISQLSAAVDADSEVEADKFIKQAEKALDDVVKAVEKATN
jgi:flagellar hook-basal body complex protein FliE